MDSDVPVKGCRSCGTHGGVTMDALCAHHALLLKQINEAPEPLRAYIHHMETNADPAGDKWRMAGLEENAKALTALIEEQQQQIDYVSNLLRMQAHHAWWSRYVE